MRARLLEYRFVRLLVIAWVRAPFGLAFFPWFARLLCMPILVRRVRRKVADDLKAGEAIGRLMVRVYGADNVLLMVRQYVEIEGGTITGRAFDVGVALAAIRPSRRA